MKKNAMLKIAAILMVAVLLTTCAISSTFAKYTTSDSAQAKARVAKFGVEVVTELDGLFAEYRLDPNDDEKFVVKGAYTADPEDEADYIIAPGMNGSVSAASTITGTPEVAVEVYTNATVSLDGWGNFCPLSFTVGTSEPITQTGTIDEFETAIANAIKKEATRYEAGTDLANKLNVTTISWVWDFERGATLDDKANNNDVDTAIAELETATIEITLETVVSQVETLTLN